MRQLANFIGGELVPPDSGQYFDDLNPATGEVIASIPDSDASDIDHAVRAADAAFREVWRETTSAERSSLLLRLADLVAANAEELVRLESEDNGKSVSLASRLDIPRAEKNLRFFATAILHATDAFHPMDGSAINYTLRQPLGVAGLISPWNLPLYLLTWKIAPAVAAGNCCVAKPSELTPLTAARLAELVVEAGFPPGVINIVHGYGRKAGEALTGHPQVPLISFTGGTVTGAAVMRAAGPLFKKVSLELGGKNPNLVFADADLDEAVAGSIRSSFWNQGEICLCGSRIFVERAVYADFLERFIERTKELKVGDPLDESVDIGALISREHLEKVAGYIDLAKREGGTIETGGGVPPDLPARLSGGFFLEPTVITGLPYDCRVLQEEIFGPVVTLTPFDSEEEAVAWANGTRYGLSASVWTTDLGRAHRVAAALDCGTVWVNTWLLRDLRVPFGGMKESGVGREGGADSLHFFTEAKNVCVRLDGGRQREARTVLTPKRGGARGTGSARPPGDGAVMTSRAPDPVGPYPHARRVGDMLYLSGIGPRRPGTDEIPGARRDDSGKVIDHDIVAQTHSAIGNIRTILEDAGSSLEQVVDVTVFLTDMERDFRDFNSVYAEYFGSIRPTRTTVGVDSLPTPIAVELKVVARA